MTPNTSGRHASARKQRQRAAADPLRFVTLPDHPQPQTLRSALKTHWPLYLFEAIELALFMISACLFTIWLFHPDSPLTHRLPNPTLRRALMGVSMGLTAVLIIRSPIGKRSGAHFNPAISLTYLRLGKISLADTLFYVIGHFLGAIFGVGIAASLSPSRIAAPSVNYAVTVPGLGGRPAAFTAELFMAALLMFAVLWASNHPRFFPYTSYLVGTLISVYVLIFAPVSGFSINPARTTGSAVFEHLYTGFWIYLTAPLLGMLASAEVYVSRFGRHRIVTPRLHHGRHLPPPNTSL